MSTGRKGDKGWRQAEEGVKDGGWRKRQAERKRKLEEGQPSKDLQCMDRRGGAPVGIKQRSKVTNIKWAVVVR